MLVTGTITHSIDVLAFEQDPLAADLKESLICSQAIDVPNNLKKRARLISRSGKYFENTLKKKGRAFDVLEKHTFLTVKSALLFF